MLTSETSKRNSTLARDRKLSVPISMPSRLLEDIDKVRGDVPRSVFVCKLLLRSVNVEEERGIEKPNGTH
jgi:hypothetical protein